jgi:hypothetical protein
MGAMQKRDTKEDKDEQNYLPRSAELEAVAPTDPKD